MKIDISIYPVKNQIQLLNKNKAFIGIFNSTNDFRNVVKYIDRIVKCSPETITELQKKFNS